MSFWMKVKMFFSKLFSTQLGAVVLTSLSSLVQVGGKFVLDELVRKAKDRAIRLDQEYPNGPGSIKRDALADYIGDVATGLGLNLSVTLVNLLIELVAS